MAYLYGLDCHKCKHDNVKAYRMRLQIRRTSECKNCGINGVPFIGDNPFQGGGSPEPGWWRCTRCRQEWRAGWEREIKDKIYRENQRDNALSQLYSLGWDDPKLDAAYVLERADDKRHTIPYGYNARMMQLCTEHMPRTSLYFRWNPMAGPPDERLLTPDKIFQCVFSPGSTPSERRGAPEIRLPDEACELIVRGDPSEAGGSKSTIQCQHCGDFLPLKAMNTSWLREVEKGD